jgi:hypothetical protein
MLHVQGMCCHCACILHTLRPLLSLPLSLSVSLAFSRLCHPCTKALSPSPSLCVPYQEWENSGDPWYRSPSSGDLSDLYDASHFTILSNCVGHGPVPVFPDQCSTKPGAFGIVTLYLGIDGAPTAP